MKIYKENYKTVEEYSKEMSREQFDKFTECEELCPSAFALEDLGVGCNSECITCWNKALVGIEFLSPVPGLPVEVTPVLKRLEELEVQSNKIDEARKQLKEELLNAMESHGIKKWENEIMTITYTAPTSRVSVDSAKLKKELPEVFSQYTKTSNVKSSIRIKLKGDK